MSNPSADATEAFSAMPNAAPSAIESCPAKVPGPAAPPANNPCAGLGMSDEKREKAFVAGFKKIQADWPKLSVDERQAKLKDLINATASPSGIPEVGVRPLKSASDAGNFDFPTWRLNLGEDQLKKASLSEAEAKSFADTTYHETRHAEQWYLMAQKEAAEGKTADEIVHDLGIPKTVAQAAVKDPLKKGDARQACANAVYDSVYGKNSGHRVDVLKKVRETKIAVESARRASEAADVNPKATDEQKKAARDAWVKSYNDFEAAYKDYKNLPEEADAWETADRMLKNW